MQERSSEAVSYRQAGVDYDVLDAAKRFAAGEAARTAESLGEPDWRGIEASRGNTAYVFERGSVRLATVLECLGTKSVLAREIEEQTGLNGFEAIGYDAVAAVVNDLICVGALPLVVNAYFASGGPGWFADGERLRRLASGWRRACEESGAIWGGGESPSLPGLVDERDIEIAGSGVGVIRDQPVLGDQLGPGDECVLVESSGLHTNGASLARLVASRDAEGYRAKLPSGASLAQALLTPSYLYVGLVRALIEASLPVYHRTRLTQGDASEARFDLPTDGAAAGTRGAHPPRPGGRDGRARGVWHAEYGRRTGGVCACWSRAARGRAGRADGLRRSAGRRGGGGSATRVARVCRRGV